MKALLITAASLIFATGANAEEYLLGVDSLPQEGVPEGTVTKHAWDASRIYPGTTHEYWVYVPAQYTEAEPAAVMVFQDGQGYASRDGTVRAPTLFDNLIHKGEVPVTIGIFLNPGKKEQAKDQRGTQYVPINDTYARFLLEEILPEVGKDYNLVEDAAGRARTNVFGKDRHSVLTVVSERGCACRNNRRRRGRRDRGHRCPLRGWHLELPIRRAQILVALGPVQGEGEVKRRGMDRHHGNGSLVEGDRRHFRRRIE